MNQGESFSILITDDDDHCREALREIVEPEGFRTLLPVPVRKRSTSSARNRCTWCCSTCICRA